MARVALCTTLWRPVGHSGTPDFADGYFVISGIGAIVISLGMRLRYRHGDFDAYAIRRRRASTARSEA